MSINSKELVRKSTDLQDSNQIYESGMNDEAVKISVFVGILRSIKKGQKIASELFDTLLEKWKGLSKSSKESLRKVAANMGLGDTILDLDEELKKSQKEE